MHAYKYYVEFLDNEYSNAENFEEFKKELKSGEGLEGITASLIRRKAVDHLVSLVKFQEPKKETVEE